MHARERGDRQTLPSMTNNPCTYPRRAGQLNAISAREEGEERRKRERERDLNAQRHECTASILHVDPGPHLRRGAGMREEGDRSAVACAIRITALNISFISGPEQLPYSTNVRSAQRPSSRSRLRTRVAPRGRLQPLLRETRQSGVVNETRPHSPLPFLLFVFFTSFRFTFPFSRSFSSSSSSSLLFLFPSAHRFSVDRLTFLHADRNDGLSSCRSRARRICARFRATAIRSCRERTISRLGAILVSLSVEGRDEAAEESARGTVGACIFAYGEPRNTVVALTDKRSAIGI